MDDIEVKSRNMPRLRARWNRANGLPVKRCVKCGAEADSYDRHPSEEQLNWWYRGACETCWFRYGRTIVTFV